MAKARNKSGVALWVPGRGEIPDGGAIEVADDDLYGYTAQTIWDPVGKDGQAIHDKAAKDEADRVAAFEEVVAETAISEEDRPQAQESGE